MHLGPHRMLVPTLRLLILTDTDFSKFSEQYHNRILGSSPFTDERDTPKE